MTRSLLPLVLLILVVCASASTRPVEFYFKFEISDRSELEQITRLVSISKVDGLVVYAYANQGQMKAFEALGYEHELLTHPGLLHIPTMAANLDQLGEWNTYPSYEQYETMMYQFEADYPGLCRIVNAGLSVQGRKILFAKISANVDVTENEPEVMYSSTMHGDETTGYVLMLRLIDTLLSSYGSEPQITEMLDNLEIWINPLANPDGTYITGNSSVNGAIRFNANGVDLNRNFPDPDEGENPDGNPYQPETIVMMDFAKSHNFVLSANFHGGMEVVNYPWDTWPFTHADDIWYVDVSRTYADSAQAYAPEGYMDDLDDGIVHGYWWYPIAGGRQDYMNYWHGCREVTCEISSIKLVSAATLPTYWEYNRVALHQYLRHAYFGIRGVVTDAETGLPVFATIYVLAHDMDNSHVYSDSVVGNYHRMIAPGTYSLTFEAEGYISHHVDNIEVVEGGITYVDVALQPGEAPPYVCGDVNGLDERVNAADLIYLLDYLYKGGPPPPQPAAADVNGSGILSAGDLIYFVDYLYRGGPDLICGGEL